MDPISNATVRGSLWLRPLPPFVEGIQAVSKRLATRTQQRAAPPHVTLLNGIALPAARARWALQALAAQMTPLTIVLGELDGRADEEFRCFFAEAGPREDLTVMHHLAREIFGVAEPRPFEPHLSLLYGYLDPSLRRQLAIELGGRLNISFQAGSVHFVNATATEPLDNWRTLFEEPLEEEAQTSLSAEGA
jgi:hypothetical protein